MYSFISGKVVEAAASGIIVIENGGIGYGINVSNPCLVKLGKIGETVKIFTRLNVREDEMSLYGFYSKEERAVFEKLITVGGIGCRLALTILSGMSVAEFAVCVATGDTRELTKIKGVGKKTAERIVLELRDKIAEDAPAAAGSIAVSPKGTAADEAVTALMSLGLTKAEASASVSRAAAPGMSAEEIVKIALKRG